ncbi:MAG TPA: SURF1 family protein [Gemmatimonadaceae bacterium]
MSRRSIVFCVLAVAAAAVFARLGLWQLARLHEKVRRNASIAAQQLEPAAQLASVPRDTAGAHYRKATVSGRFDYDQEVVLGARTHQGSPGVDLITPLRIAGSDTAILVNRGWVYSPDGVTADRARWRERDTATITGYIEVYAPDAGVTNVAREPRLVRRLSRSELASRIRSPLAPYYLVATGDSADGAHPARRELPALDEGPHRSYAMQWFAFMAIALAGAGLVIARERRRE